MLAASIAGQGLTRVGSSSRSVELPAAELGHAAPPLLCHPAYSCDRAAIMVFLAGMGEVEDYVPRLWDSWLPGWQGLLAVRRQRGQVVVQGHLMHLGQGE